MFFFHVLFHLFTYMTADTSAMCLFVCKIHFLHCHVKHMKIFLEKREIVKHLQKKDKHILDPSQRCQDSRHLLQNPKVLKSIMSFNNHAQSFTGPIYLDEENHMTNSAQWGRVGENPHTGDNAF